jgi:hypothetical protein
MNADKIEVTVYQNTITLRGTREPAIAESEANLIRRERVEGPFARTIVLPFRVDADKVAARFERGMLTLELPRPAEDRPRHIKLSSGAGSRPAAIDTEASAANASEASAQEQATGATQSNRSSGPATGGGQSSRSTAQTSDTSPQSHGS